MSRIGTPTNLKKDGTYDLLLVSFPEGYPEGKMDFKLEDTPRKITGIQKVAQLFLKVLLTTQGSDLINVGLGTNFKDYATRSNRTGLSQELYGLLASAIESAEAQVQYITQSDDQDKDSQLRSASVLGFRDFDDGISIFIKLITEAGEEASIAIPFPQLDMKLRNG